MPLLVAHALLGGEPGRRLGARDVGAAIAAGAAVTASVVTFQAASVRLVPALLGALPSFALLAFAWRRYRRTP
jgi:hypothetical protein